jgi:hypothetical protein
MTATAACVVCMFEMLTLVVARRLYDAAPVSMHALTDSHATITLVRDILIE